MDKFIVKRKASELDIEILPDSTEIPDKDLNAINSYIVTHKVKRAKYARLDAAQKLEVGRYAAQHGVTVTTRQFHDKYDLKPSIVRDYRTFASKYKEGKQYYRHRNPPIFIWG